MLMGVTPMGKAFGEYEIAGLPGIFGPSEAFAVLS
jgi:hypothetical protein